MGTDNDDWERPLPPYSYVPKGPWPHPTSSPQGHLADRTRAVEPPIVDQAWQRSGAYLRGFELFNAGYYWEAHEVWESLWHAHGRRGPLADFLRGLIKIAAAGVKVRERQPRGVTTHALRAAELFAAIRDQAGPEQLGLDLNLLETLAREIAANPPGDSGSTDDRVVRVFSFRLEPGTSAKIRPSDVAPAPREI